jgi:hypothetical protein
MTKYFRHEGQTYGIREFWLEANRPAWPPAIEIQAQANDAFEAWRQKRDPDGECDILDLIEEYAKCH